MTYTEAREFIDQSNQYGSKLGLETITELLSRLGNPQEKLKLVHVAGTNGKGSTTAFIVSILAEAGYMVGRYISPAVFSYRERIQITRKGQGMPSETAQDTEYITEEGVSSQIEMIQRACSDMVKEGYSHPTSFEIETAMAMLYFVETAVDFAVIEVGLGGRLDATNVMKQPVCCIITSISMDHMQYLGNSLTEIAREKAGIIKEGRPVVTCNAEPEVRNTIQEVSRYKNAPFYTVDSREAEVTGMSPEGTAFRYQEKEYVIRLLGLHQVVNAQLAMKAAEVLNQSGYHISEAAIQRGLQHANWRGRFEVIARNPYFIIDGAHNEDAALRLAEAIELYFKGKRLIYIMGVFADKEYEKIVRITAPLAELVLTLQSSNSRALSSELLAQEVKKYCPAVIDAKTVEQAVAIAYQEAKPEDVILAFGSLSFLGELMEQVSWMA